MEIVYTLLNQFTFDEDRLQEYGYTQEDLLKMSNEDIINLMVDMTRDGGDNEFSKCEFELFNEEDESVKYFDALL